MFYSVEQILIIGAIMTCGSIVQGAVGFASGLLGVPLLVLSGLSIPEAATINLVSTSVQNIWGAWHLREHLEPRELVLPVTVRWLMIPSGVIVAHIANQNLNPMHTKQLIGLVLLAIVFFLLLCHVKPREQVGLVWQLLAFIASGFMLGFCTMGGATLVIYVNALNWSAAKSRGFLFFCSATSIPVVSGMLWLKFGSTIVTAALSTLTIMPLIFAGLWLGLQLGHRLSKKLFRKITYTLLVIVALSAIAGPAIWG